MNKSSFGSKKVMKFNLEIDEVKDVLFQHLRKQMTADEEIQYLQGKSQMSLSFHPYAPPVLNFEIISR